MNWYKKNKNKKKNKDNDKESDKEFEKDFMSVSQYGLDAVNLSGDKKDSNDNVYLT